MPRWITSHLDFEDFDTEHLKEADVVYNCADCDLAFSIYTKFAQHLILKHDRYYCTTCSTHFQRPEDLTGHRCQKCPKKNPQSLGLHRDELHGRPV